MSTVADLLIEAQTAHLAYRAALPRPGVPGDPIACRVALAYALDRRLAAHAADPTHTDPAWISDGHDPTAMQSAQATADVSSAAAVELQVQPVITDGAPTPVEAPKVTDALIAFYTAQLAR